MRWRPLLIHFALNIKYSSASVLVYHAIRDSGNLTFTERTLRDYTHWVSTEASPKVQVTEHIKKTINLDEMSKSEKKVLGIDEMKVQSEWNIHWKTCWFLQPWSSQ